ncbi:MAG: FAD-dependent oxidoreductase [Planctomycetaceae bacterium]|nr:MAG: FAD-dependent oxidoreductase [Planctomycetaceae bacterium]
MRPMNRVQILGAALAAWAVVTTGGLRAEGVFVRESQRQIPVAYEVDVVVVGGGTGAVAAAVSAAQAGASVFLAAPYPYLGDDMTATLRLWLEPGEEPMTSLAQAIYNDPVAFHVGPHPDRLSLTYSASLPTGAPHHDTNPPSRLTNGQWGNAASQSVQFNGSVMIDADLGQEQTVREARIVVYHREHEELDRAFVVDRVRILTSNDAEQWTETAIVENVQGRGSSDTPVMLAAQVEADVRYVRFDVVKSDKAARVLIGEIEVLTAAQQQTEDLVRPPRPLHVKKTLENALLDADIPFLFSCYPTDVLRDASGALAGIVMANRTGRQAVLARTIVDATDRGAVARLAGAPFRPYPAGTHSFRRVVIGGEPVKIPSGTARVIDPPFSGFCECRFPGRCPVCLGQTQPHASSGPFPVIEYTIDLEMPDGSFASFNAADQLARTLTYHSAQQSTADRLFQVPPDGMHGRTMVQDDQVPVADLPLDAFRPQGIERLYLLGGAADVSRARAERLVRPIELMELGARIGVAAAQQAEQVGELVDVRLTGQTSAADVNAGEIRELLAGIRPVETPRTIPQDARSLPVLGHYDVVIIGGGTGGAPAGIAAAREGAKVLVVEYLHMLGGVGTAGFISTYYWGNREGFTATVPGGARWEPEQKAEWWRETLRDAGAEVWFGTMGCGAVVRDDRVTGAVVATPEGRGVVLAGVVIDSTGNSDIAAAAGAETDYTDAGEFGMQGTGLPPRRLGASYTNTDFTIVDETDMLDIWHVFVYAKQKYPEAFDQGKLIDTRERRRIIGDFYMTILDQMVGRTYPDTIARSYSDFDSHGFTIDPYLLLETPPHRHGFWVNIPYRCLLPRGLEGVLVTGLGISVHRDAVPLTRMQPCIQNQGYAAGLAAAMASRTQSELRAIDIKYLQQRLIETGNLPDEVYGHEDSVPMSAEAIAQAVQEAPDDYRAAAVVFLHDNQALPLLRKAYSASEGDRRIAYAQKLAMLGDDSGTELLIQRVRAAQAWDQGWNYRGMGQYGNAFSPLDTDIVALGMSGDRKAVPAILKMADLLDAEADFSHHRAVAMAFERLGDPSAAPALAALLAKPGISGHVHDTVQAAMAHDGQEARYLNAVHTRRESLRELLLARALFRLGDHEGIGRATLEAYTTDLRGHLARHARAVLDDTQNEVNRD